MPKVAEVLTPATVAKFTCPPGKPSADKMDGLCKGLLLRATPNQKSFNFKYEPPREGPRTTMFIGFVPRKGSKEGISLDDARTEVERLRKILLLGKDPANEKADMAAAKALLALDNDPAKPKNWTVRTLVANYHQERLLAKGDPAAAAIADAVADLAKVSSPFANLPGKLAAPRKRRARQAGLMPLRTAHKINSALKLNVVPLKGDMLARDFTIADMNDILAQVAGRGCFVMANRVFSVTKRLFKYAVQKGCRATNPLAELDAPYPEFKDERFLELEEIKHLWTVMPTALAGEDTLQRLLKLYLLLGKRNGELCRTERSFIDWNKRLLTIPAEYVKGRNGTAKKEEVPLCEMALRIFKEAADASTHPVYIFPNHSGSNCWQNTTVAEYLSAALTPTDELPLGRLGMKYFTAHALRRTVGTHLMADDEEGNNIHGIEEKEKFRVLNHMGEVKKNVSQTHYDGNNYIARKAKTLRKWEAFLAELVGEPTGLRKVA